MNRAHRFDAMHGEPEVVAKRLLGQRLVRVLRGKRMAGTIVEVEAYLGPEDRASHTFDGHRSARNEAMYGPPGTAYVYFTYGMHHCLNVVCGRKGEGVAVLIRAIEPDEGIDQMRAHCDKPRTQSTLCRGPGRLTEALAISRALNGIDLRTSDELFIECARVRALERSRIERTPRIGLNLKHTWRREHLDWVDRPLRFVLRQHDLA